MDGPLETAASTSSKSNSSSSSSSIPRPRVKPRREEPMDMREMPEYENMSDEDRFFYQPLGVNLSVLRGQPLAPSWRHGMVTGEMLYGCPTDESKAYNEGSSLSAKVEPNDLEVWSAPGNLLSEKIWELKSLGR